MPTAYVRTLPHYMPEFRAWRPVKLKVLVCDSQRERITATLSLLDVEGRFNSPFGSRSTSIICWKEPGSAKDECVGEFTIWPRASGKPKLCIASPDSDFTQTTIEAVENTGPLRTHSLDRSHAVITLQRKRTMKYIKPSLAVILGAFIWFTGYYVGKLSVTPQTPVEQIAQSATLATAPTESSEEPTAETPPLTPVVEAPAAQTPVVAAPPAPVVTKRTDCAFADPNRTQDVNGKVAIECVDGSAYRAKAVYLGEGAYEFVELDEDPIGP